MHSYCRLCATLNPNSKLLNLQIDLKKRCDIIEKLKFINGYTDFSDEILPQTVCFVCSTSLNQAFEFVLGMKRAQNVLAGIFHTNNVRQESLSIEEDSIDPQNNYNIHTQNVKQESTCSSEEDSVGSKNDYNIEDIKIEIDCDDDNIKPYGSNISSIKLETCEQNTEQNGTLFVSSIESKIGESNDANNESNYGNNESNYVNNKSNEEKNESNYKNNDYRNNESNYVNNELNDKNNESNNENNEQNAKGSITVEVRKKAEEQSKANTSPKTFTVISRLVPKLRSTWKDYCWTCKVCETQFPHIDELTLHSMTYHNACNAFYCLECNKSTLRLDKFINHVKGHRKDLKLSCYKCNKTFNHFVETKLHAKEHKSTDYICEGCNTCFATRELLNEHTNMYFKQIWPRTSSNLSHICDKCGKHFLTNNSLEVHLITHDEARPYVCEICNATFKIERTLNGHMITHAKTKPYTCDKCGKDFLKESYLKAHSIVHTDLFPYKCSYCDKKFRFHSVWVVHKRQHTGVKPYTCEICQRKFVSWANYNKHMKGKHGRDMSKKRQTISENLKDPTTRDVPRPVTKKVKKRNIKKKLDQKN